MMDWLICSCDPQRGARDGGMCRGVECIREVGGKNLREQRVQAVDLLPLLDVGVVLRHTLQGELLHQVNLVRPGQELVTELLH